MARNPAGKRRERMRRNGSPLAATGLPSPSPDEKGAGRISHGKTARSRGGTISQTVTLFQGVLCKQITINDNDSFIRCLRRVILVVIFICKSILEMFHINYRMDLSGFKG